MNLVHHGIHASTDWLLIKLRAIHAPVELIAMPDGQLNARPYHPTNKPPRFGASQGVYRNGISYRELYEELQFLRQELVA